MSKFHRHAGGAAVLLACAVLAYVVFRPAPLEKPISGVDFAVACSKYAPERKRYLKWSPENIPTRYCGLKL